MSSRGVCAFFYTDLGDGNYQCKQCDVQHKQAAHTGYTNLLSHLAAKHPGFLEQWTAHQQSLTTTLDGHGFYDQRIMDLCKTAEWIVARNLPVSEVDDPLTRGMLRVSPVSAKTLVSYMRHVAVKVGDRISNTMGDKFGIMCDGWSSGTTHFVAIYAVYTVKDESGVDVLKQPLLAISPDERSQTADAHIKMIDNILSLYDKHRSMLLFIVGDNCATNQAIATRVNFTRLIWSWANIGTWRYFSLAFTSYDSSREVSPSSKRIAGSFSSKPLTLKRTFTMPWPGSTQSLSMYSCVSALGELSTPKKLSG